LTLIIYLFVKIIVVTFYVFIYNLMNTAYEVPFLDNAVVLYYIV